MPGIKEIHPKISQFASHKEDLNSAQKVSDINILQIRHRKIRKVFIWILILLFILILYSL